MRQGHAPVVIVRTIRLVVWRRRNYRSGMYIAMLLSPRGAFSGPVLSLESRGHLRVVEGFHREVLTVRRSRLGYNLVTVSPTASYTNHTRRILKGSRERATHVGRQVNRRDNALSRPFVFLRMRHTYGTSRRREANVVGERSFQACSDDHSRDRSRVRIEEALSLCPERAENEDRTRISRSRMLIEGFRPPVFAGE